MSVCVSVCLSVRRELSKALTLFARAVYTAGNRVKFVYKGHRVEVKVKVTGAKRSKIPISAMQNFDRQ